MANVVVVGAQWGDEGKGKIVDIFTGYADDVIRFQGGTNAGHTLVVGTTRWSPPNPSEYSIRGRDVSSANGVVLDGGLHR